MQKNNSVPTGTLTGAMSRSDYHKFANPNSVPKVYAREETRERTPMLKGWNTKRIKVVPKAGSVDFAGNERKTDYVTSTAAKIKAVLSSPDKGIMMHVNPNTGLICLGK